MEIHRRTRPSSNSRNSNNGPDSEPNKYLKQPSKSPQPVGRISAPHSSNSRPYSPCAPSIRTMADAILLRCIQLLLTVTAAWFLYLVISINYSKSGLDSYVEDDGGAVSSYLDNVGASFGDSFVGNSIGANDGSVRGQADPNPENSALSNSIPNLLSNPKVDPTAIAKAKEEISRLREEFHFRYGGKDESLAMLKRGLRTFETKQKSTSKENSVHFTALRLLRSILQHEVLRSQNSPQTQQSNQPQFIMAFGGYSVTVGRGNHFSQSFPFVMHSLLSPILSLQPLGIELVVRNSAIGGIPSFPYGWCLPNFLGGDADSVSWDYGMNEGSGAGGLESYVRHSVLLPIKLAKPTPMFVLVDTKRPRLDLLQKYVDMGVLSDPIALSGKDAVDQVFLEMKEEDRPDGFKEWDKWGAPPGAPGQSPWHPKKKEHELMGWMMAMHMLDAIDESLRIMLHNADWRSEIQSMLPVGNGTEGIVMLPPPLNDMSKTGAAAVLYGTPLQNNNHWHMHHVSCRASFLPNISGNLTSIIQSGVTQNEKTEADMLEPRDDDLFKQGWVMDVGKVERETKVKVNKYGGLGYIDMKMALYGIPASGTLEFWLPYEVPLTSPQKDTGANQYFSSIIVCEVNEKRGDKECNMLNDLTFHVGGALIAKSEISQISGVASYLKKDICVHLKIPKEAQISSRIGSGNSDKSEGSTFGVSLDVTVTGMNVTRENGACSISHVIWQHQ